MCVHTATISNLHFPWAIAGNAFATAFPVTPQITAATVVKCWFFLKLKLSLDLLEALSVRKVKGLFIYYI